jgi:hypothetical protein
MATRTGVARAITIHPSTDYSSPGVQLAEVRVYFDNNDVVVTGGADTLAIVFATAMSSIGPQDGKTYTPKVQGHLFQAYRSGSTQVFGTVTGTTTISLTPTTSDFSTAATVSATDPVDAPFCVSMLCVVT